MRDLTEIIIEEENRLNGLVKARMDTTGEDQPTPAISVTHSTFSVVDQLTGRFGFSEIGFELGPRKRGQ